jgi:hypothetical protein
MDKEQAYARIKEIIKLVAMGEITDSRGICKIMKVITKQYQSEAKWKLRN